MCNSPILKFRQVCAYRSTATELIKLNLSLMVGRTRLTPETASRLTLFDDSTAYTPGAVVINSRPEISPLTAKLTVWSDTV
jgi:hypothetical protein